MIFLFTCEVNRFHINNFGSTGDLLASTLGAVCQSWRELSLATPVLWAGLYVADGSTEQQIIVAKEKQMNRLLKTLRLYFERSQAVPLYVTMGDIDNFKDQNQIIQQLNNVIGRCFQLHYIFGTRLPLREVETVADNLLKLADGSGLPRRNPKASFSDFD
ncbi:hypothetical protein K435DRAFT_853188 [Dendrothele bispora CBS 962.96]|uniref:F-box domain-containing protein n=1 Tax=Dendrothele bispora (strain CBS 962.96) TaxID=1314807 RepID=A0A4S8MHB7_DENBC|nr:hypothetical protein K435DRAFT_853188 [Dendrothele bispora CBS 962.96]